MFAEIAGTELKIIPSTMAQKSDHIFITVMPFLVRPRAERLIDGEVNLIMGERRFVAGKRAIWLSEAKVH